MPYHYNPSGYLRKKGEKWQACVDYPDPDRPGKRKRHTKNAPTKKEAQALLTAMMAEHQAQPQWRKPSELLVADFVARWLSTVVDPSTLAPSTKTVKRVMASHIVTHFSKSPLVDLTPLAIQEFLKSLADAGYASRTLRAAFDTLHQVLDTAVQWNLLTLNPVDRVEPPRVIYRDKHPLTQASSETTADSDGPSPNTLQAFLDAAARDPQYALWVTLLGTGLRLGEALGLFWSDIDWDRRSLVVQRTLSPLGMLRPPKAHSQRRVAIPATVMSVLEEHHMAQRALKTRTPAWRTDPDYVFTTRTGLPLSAGNMRRSLRRLGAVAHIPPPFTPHDLRHTYATMMLEMDVHLTIVQKQLGHSSIRVTSDIYSHLSNRVQDTAGAAMDSVLGGHLALCRTQAAKIRKQAAVETQKDPK